MKTRQRSGTPGELMRGEMGVALMKIITYYEPICARCFNFRHLMFVFAHLFPDISIKTTKLHFKSWKKFSLTISLFFRQTTAEVSRNNCAKRRKD